MTRRHPAFWPTVAAAGFGALWGVAHPLPLSSVEIAQVVSGVVTPPPQTLAAFFYQRMYSVVVDLAAIMLWLGLGVEAVCRLLSIVMSTGASLAISIAAYAFTSNATVAFAAPLAMWSGWFFPNELTAHKYPLLFPLNQFDMGPTGFAAALLTLGVTAARPAIGVSLVPFVVVIHPSLGIATAAVVAGGMAFDRGFFKKVSRQPRPIVGAVACAALLWMLHQYLAPPSAVPLPGQSDVRYAEGFIRWWDFHRAPLIGEDASVGDLLGLLWFDLLFLSVGVAALWRRPAILERVRFWIAGQVIVTVIAVLIVSANEWSLASVPWLLQSAMPARWLNLNNVVLPLLAVALLIHVGGEHLRRLVSPYARPLHGASVIAMIAVIFSATPLQAFDFWGPHRSLLTQVASRPGLFIIGGQTTGLELAQLRTGRVPLLQDHLLNILGYFPEFAPAVEEILNDVWGVSLLSDADAWAIDEDSSRWSARGLDDWQAIRAKYQVTDVIVPRDWTLRLPLVTESAALRLYSIP